MRHLSLLFLALSLLAAPALTGCYRVSTTHGRGSEVTGRRADYSRWQHHLLAGLIRAGAHVDLDQICPEGVAAIRTDVSFFNGFVAWLTGGVYTPTRLKVWCEHAPARPVFQPQPTYGPSATFEVPIEREDLDAWVQTHPDQVEDFASLVRSELLAAQSGTRF
ncbi:MAG: hypothetical protein AB8H86_19340 [Polyangiales bacterium]